MARADTRVVARENLRHLSVELHRTTAFKSLTLKPDPEETRGEHFEDARPGFFQKIKVSFFAG